MMSSALIDRIMSVIDQHDRYPQNDQGAGSLQRSGANQQQSGHEYLADMYNSRSGRFAFTVPRNQRDISHDNSVQSSRDRNYDRGHNGNRRHVDRNVSDRGQYSTSTNHRSSDQYGRNRRDISHDNSVQSSRDRNYDRGHNGNRRHVDRNVSDREQYSTSTNHRSSDQYGRNRRDISHDNSVQSSRNRSYDRGYIREHSESNIDSVDRRRLDQNDRNQRTLVENSSQTTGNPNYDDGYNKNQRHVDLNGLDRDQNNAPANQPKSADDKMGKRNRIKNAINVLRGKPLAVDNQSKDARPKDAKSIMDDYDSKTHRKTALKNVFKGTPRALLKSANIGIVGAFPGIGPPLSGAINKTIEDSKTFGDAGTLRPVDPRDLIPNPKSTNKDGTMRTKEELDSLWNDVYDQRMKIKEAQDNVNERISNKIVGGFGAGLSQVAGISAAATAIGVVTMPVAAVPIGANVISQPPAQMIINGLENQHRSDLKMGVPKIDDNGDQTRERVKRSLFVTKKVAKTLPYTSEQFQDNV